MGTYQNIAADGQQKAKLDRLKVQKMLTDMRTDKEKAFQRANKFEREAIKAQLDILTKIRDLLESPDPRKQDRAQAITSIYKAYAEDSAGEVKKELAEIDDKLSKLGIKPDGSLSPTWGSSSDQAFRTRLNRKYSTQGSNALVDYLTSDAFKEDEGGSFKMGAEFSDLLLNEMLTYASLPTLDDGTPEEILREAYNQLTRPQVAKLKAHLGPAISARNDRMAEVRDLLEDRGTFAHAMGRDLAPGEAYELATRKAEDIFPLPVSAYESSDELLASLGQLSSNTSGLAAETGRSVDDLMNDPSVSNEMFGQGASYVAALRQARTRMVDDPGFRLWLQDRGIKLPEGAMPSPMLANRYLHAKESGKTSRLSKKPRATGQTLTYTLRAGKEYDIGATGRGGAPLYAVNADGEYLTAEQLGEMSDKALPSANVIMARLADVRSGEPLSAISALVAPGEKEQFEEELLGILNDKDQVGDARILVDKTSMTIQVVNRSGKILQVHKPDPDAFDGVFASLSQQPDLFTAAGTAAALAEGRGGNVLASLNPGAEIGSMLEGGIGVAIPAGVRLNAEEPTVTFTDRSRRFFAAQDPNEFHTMSGRKFLAKDVVSITDASGTPVAGAPVEDGAVSAADGAVPAAQGPGRLRQFGDKLRAKGSGRRFARHRRGFDDPVEHTVSKLGIDDLVPSDTAVPVEDVPVLPDVPTDTGAEDPATTDVSPAVGASPANGSGAARSGVPVEPREDDVKGGGGGGGGSPYYDKPFGPLAWVRNLKVPRGYNV